MATITYNGKTYSKTDLAKMKGTDLVSLHNELADKAKVSVTRRFSSIGAGLDRTWRLLDQLGAKSASEIPAAKPVKAKKSKKGPKPVQIDIVSGPLIACRAGSQQAKMVDALRNGITLDKLATKLAPGARKGEMEPTSGFRSRILAVLKSKGYGVATNVNGLMTLVLPEGAEIPPHKPAKNSKKAG